NEIIAQPAGDAMDDGVFQIVAIQNGSAQNSGEIGLALEGVFGLFTQFAPQRITLCGRMTFVLRLSRGGDQSQMAGFRRHGLRPSPSKAMAGRRISSCAELDGVGRGLRRRMKTTLLWICRAARSARGGSGNGDAFQWAEKAIGRVEMKGLAG